MYKLAVLDIDGTLVDNQGYLSKRTIQTINQVKKTGAIVTICTGRNIRKAMPIVQKAGIEVPFVCIDGAIMYDPKERRILQDLSLTREEVIYIVDLTKKEDAFIEVSDGDKYYKYMKTKKLQQYDMFNKHTLLGRVRSYLGGIRYLKEASQLYQIPGSIYQVVIASDHSTVQQIKQKIEGSSLERIEIRDYLYPDFLFINRKGIKKSYGVQMLCEQFQVSMEEVVTIGDEMNDIDMLETAGMGVAMGNGVEQAKKAANYITLNNTQDGAAFALEKFFL